MPNPLRQNQTIRVLDAVEAELGATDRSRLGELSTLIDAKGRIQLSAALDRLFPDFTVEDALTRFRQLRARLRQAADAAGVELELAVDTDKRSSPDQRWCWFEGESLAAAEAERYSREAAQGAQPVETIRQEALVQTGKPVVRYFVSYARKDSKLKDSLLERLESRFDCSPDFVFEGWQDGDILPGENWRAEIERALEHCHFGLLLISHEFLASRFIAREELPRFVSGVNGEAVRRSAVPVGLKKVPFDGSADLKGLEALQIFRHEDRFYSQRGADHTRDAFADELFRRILAVVRKYIASPDFLPERPSAAAPSRRRGVAPDGALLLAREQRFYLEETGDSAERIVPTEAMPTRLAKNLEEGAGGERVPALGYLEDWLRRPGAPPFCALLGEYGMGKTTTCKALTLRLLDAREDEPTLPLPIYLDLRHVGELAKTEPVLSDILDTVVRKSWYGGREVTELGAREIVRLVQQEGALAIFDGLDEVLVHLSPAAGQRFTRELWRILPPAVFRRGREAAATPKGGEAKPANGAETSRPGRLLISCRTHYFRTLREQTTHFTGEDREGISTADYQALLLLPFSEEQIRDYLRRNLPEQDLDGLLELIRSVHDLQELAERPYTLSLIAGRIGDLERWKMEGRKVTGVTLYRSMVQSWLERDTGKHELTPDHKQRLMEHLAAALWRSGSRTWNVGALEQWLIDFLEANPRLAAHYRGKDREPLKKDLRTATFVVNEGQDEFRFAHTSLQEFFLAAWLHRALVEVRLEDWEMAVPSRETLHFLGQMLEEEGAEEGLRGLRALRDGYRRQASELAFAYVLYALRRGLPTPQPAGVRLAGADLRGWRIEGGEDGPLLNLREADFGDARLEGAVFERVDLSGASLRRARLVRAELLDGRARGADFEGAALAGCRFRRVDLERCRFQGAALHRTQLLSCRLAGVDLDGIESGSLLADCEPAKRYPSTRPPADEPRTATAVTGHGGAVLSCAFSADGRRVVSAGYDGTVRVWDAASGDGLLTLEGHNARVLSCAFSADGTRVVSAGYDGTVRVWDAASGEGLLKLEGHFGAVSSCAFSADGRLVVSAGDGTVRVLDAASGEGLLKLEGHGRPVLSCAFLADGRHVVSAGFDGTVRVWDAGNGAQLLKLEGHDGRVNSCVFSANGQRVVSAGYDGTVRIWDSGSGDELLKLKGHDSPVTSCALSADGRRVVSAGYDGVRVWDAASGDQLLKLEGHGGPVNSCALSADGRRAVSAGGTIWVWDLASGDELFKLGAHGVRVFSCSLSANGRRLVSTGFDGVVWVWDSMSGGCLLKLEGHSGVAFSCALSADGRRVASAGYDGTVRVWDAASGDALLKLEGHGDWVFSCAFAADGRRVVSAGQEGTVRVWDTRSGDELLRLEGHGSPVHSCAFSADGRRVVSAGYDRTVRVWDAANGDALLKLEGHGDWVKSCAFSADGRRIVSAGWDGTVRVWDAASGVGLLELEGHSAPVSSCAFSADGRRVVSVGYDETARVWDAASGDELLRLSALSPLNSCAMSADGRRLITGGDDGAIRVWDAATGQPVDFLIQHLPSNELALLSPDASEIRWATPGAWRWLGWAAPDRESGAMTMYPAEIFGPLPPPPGPA